MGAEEGPWVESPALNKISCLLLLQAVCWLGTRRSMSCWGWLFMGYLVRVQAGTA